jgi:RimJ/RimL family protein N-acetyltransferase
MIDPRNLRSIRVAEKIGLYYEKDADCGGYIDRIYVAERRNTVE